MLFRKMPLIAQNVYVFQKCGGVHGPFAPPWLRLCGPHGLRWELLIYMEMKGIEGQLWKNSWLRFLKDRSASYIFFFKTWGRQVLIIFLVTMAHSLQVCAVCMSILSAVLMIVAMATNSWIEVIITLDK